MKCSNAEKNDFTDKEQLYKRWIPGDTSEILLNLFINSFVGLMSEFVGVVSGIRGEVSVTLLLESFIYDRVSVISDLGFCKLPLLSLIWSLFSVTKDLVSLISDIGSLIRNLDSVINDLVSLIPSPGLKSEPGESELSLFRFFCFLLISTRAYRA